MDIIVFVDKVLGLACATVLAVLAVGYGILGLVRLARYLGWTR